jgi:hypothetical protein
MDIKINTTEYSWIVEKPCLVTKCHKSGIFQSHPHLYNVNVIIAGDKELTDYPREILGRVVTSALVEYFKK